MTTVLFTAKNSNYHQFNVDCFDETRNALAYTGRDPVIAHPPCRLWSRMSGLSTAQENEKYLAIYAVFYIQKFGGVLEHPATSKLWKAMNLPLGNKIDAHGGFTMSINQSWFGHVATKKTWLYIVGITPAELPPWPITFDLVEQKVGGGKMKKGLKECERKWRSATPPQLCKWLIDVVTLIKNKSEQK